MEGEIIQGAQCSSRVRQSTAGAAPARTALGGISRGSSWLRSAKQSWQAQSTRYDPPSRVTEEICAEYEQSEQASARLNQRFKKVPPYMRLANPKDYDPMFFTFGPCHAKFEESLPSCDLVKVQIAQALTSKQSFRALLGEIESRDENIKKIYEEYLWPKDDIEPQVLAYLLALDALTIVAGAFYLAPLRLLHLGPALWHDAMLFEQQLPLFILQAAIKHLDPDILSKLDPLVDTSSTQEARIMKDMVRFYAVENSYPFMRNAKSWKWQDPSTLELELSMLSHIHHSFLTPELIAPQGARNAGHCVRIVLEPPSLGVNILSRSAQFRRRSAQFRRLPTASKLRRCGIRFSVGKGGFTGIEFDTARRVVKLPEITVFNTLKPYLLNLVAQEVTISVHAEDECAVSSYIRLMDDLIDNEEDVKLLVDYRVIHNMLGSHADVAAMWNTLTVNLPISFTPNDEKVIGDVLDASGQCLSISWAGFRDTYCDKLKPWIWCSVITALFLLILTFLQTFYTIKGYDNN